MSEKKTIITKSGEKHTVTAETNKYYICDKTAFRKSSAEIADIKTQKCVKKTEKTREKCDEAESAGEENADN